MKKKNEEKKYLNNNNDKRYYGQNKIHPTSKCKAPHLENPAKKKKSSRVVMRTKLFFF
jgi:hypothetical protein